MSKITRPSNYDRLTSTCKAIVDDHIRAGKEPPKFTDARIGGYPSAPRIEDLPED